MSRKMTKKLGKMKGDRGMQIISGLLLLGLLFITGYPVIYVISCSFSSSAALSAGKVLLWPVDFSLAGYEFVMNYKQVWIGYRNTIIYTILGVIVTMTMQICCAYPLSKADYQGRKPLTRLYMFIMMFGAGLIPRFLINAKLGLVGSPWAVILAGSLSVSNVIILRTAFCSIPGELYDAAKIDGANDFQTLFKIALPLAKATLSVLVLYSIVGSWNDYFNAMIYLRDPDYYPLQLVLRNILTASESLDLSSISSTDMLMQANNATEQIKYALIVMSTAPVLAAYAIVQKHFEKGVMIGAVKG